MKKLFKDYLIQTIAGITVTVAVGLWSFIDWQSLKNVVCAIWRFFAMIFTFKIPIWAILLFSAALIFILWLIEHFQSKKQTNDTHPLLPFSHYTEDTIKGYRCKWQYELDIYTNKYKITDIRVFCPDCGKLLVKDSFIDSFQCVHCQRPHYLSEIQIQTHILTQIENKTYPIN